MTGGLFSGKASQRREDLDSKDGRQALTEKDSKGRTWSPHGPG